VNVLQLAAALPALVAGGGSWAACFFVLRRQWLVPVALAVGPALAGCVAVLLLRDIGHGADAAAFTTAWILAPAVFWAAASTGDRLNAAACWVLVGLGLLAQLVGIIDGGPRVTVGLPGLGDALTADICRLALVAATAVIAGPALRRLPVRRAKVERSLFGLAACWATSVLLCLGARDIGQAVLTLVLALVLLHSLTLRLASTGALAVLLLAGVGLGIAVMPHGVRRVERFVTIGQDKLIDQEEMAIYAASSGRLVGVGVGRGGLSVIGTTTGRDWLLAATGRVFGFCGVLAVLAALASLGSACLRLALGAETGRARVAATGAGIWVFVQLIVAAAGVFAVVPETGLAPPFFGAGRVPVLVFAAVLGLAAPAAPRARARRLR
jgi:hypothetical protein